MYKNTHTQNKNSAKKKTNKQTNNTPPPAKKQNKTFSCFVWIYYRMQRFHSDFLFEEKKRRIWLSSMTHTVTHSPADYCNHRSLFDKSMKFGTRVVLDITWDISYDAKLNRSKICYFGVKQ